VGTRGDRDRHRRENVVGSGMVSRAMAISEEVVEGDGQFLVEG